MRARLACGVAAASLLWPLAVGCGVLVHNEVLHRAIHLFAHRNSNPRYAELQHQYYPLLAAVDAQPAVQAGAFFPDWGYQCLGTDDDAEAAHWPPFLVAASEHIVTHYGLLDHPRSPDEQDHLENLIAFVFAIASHQTADATWHAIRLPSGFLAALTAVDFAGDGGQAHRVLDLGGDFLSATRLARLDNESTDWLATSWVVPVQDILQIYERMGRSVSSLVVRYCSMRGLAALRSELVLGPSLHDSFVNASPMLLDELDRYHLGGLDEMAARTVNCWANLTRWFSLQFDEDEKLRAGWGICDVFQAIRARGGAGLIEKAQPKVHHDVMAHAIAMMTEMDVSVDAFGAETYSLPPLKNDTDAPASELRRRGTSNAHLDGASRAPKLKAPSYIATYVPYGHLGSSLVVGNFAPGEVAGLGLAVGAPWETEDSARPGEGSLYVIPVAYIPDSTPLVPQSLAPGMPYTQIAAPSEGSVDQRFGTAVAGLKALNKTLVCVSAPGPLSYDSSAPPSLPFADLTSAGRIDFFPPGRGGSVSRLLSITLKGAELGSIGHRWWGEKMISADLDGTGEEYLIVAGSKSDSMRVCEGRRRWQYGEGEVLVLKISRSAFNSAKPNEDDMHIYLEGGGREATYAASGIKVDSYSLSLPPSEKESVACDRTGTYEYFGASLAFSAISRTLFIGAPGSSGTGKVFAYQRDADSDSLKHVYTVSPDLAVAGTVRAAFGGGGLATGVTPDGHEWLAVGAHNQDTSGAPQAGVVQVFDLSAGPAAGAPEMVAEVSARPLAEDDEGGDDGAMKHAKFGRSLVPDGTGVGLWIGAPGFDGERGAVWWASLVADDDGDGVFTPESPVPYFQHSRQHQLQYPVMPTVRRVLAELAVRGDEPNAHFGATLATAVLDGEGKGGSKSPALIVGVPEAGVGRPGQHDRFYGALAVFRRNESGGDHSAE